MSLVPYLTVHFYLGPCCSPFIFGTLRVLLVHERWLKSDSVKGWLAYMLNERNIPHRLVCFNTRYPVGGAVHERLCNRWEAEPCWRKCITLGRLRRFIAMSCFLFFVWMGMWSASSCSCWCAFHTMKGYLYPSGTRNQNKLSSLSCFYLQCSIIATEKGLYIYMEWFPWCLPVMSFLIPSAILQPFIPLCRAGDWVQRLSSLFWLA